MSPLPSGDPRLERLLLGRSRAHGLFQDFTGAVRRRFTVELEGRLEGDELVLREDFLFDDGEKDVRVWRIVPREGGVYTATADDMIGEARGGLRSGVLKWTYLFSLKIGARRVRVRFHDVFVQLSEHLLLNTARVTFAGFEIGRTTIIFELAG
jgi:hypothetical protein